MFCCVEYRNTATSLTCFKILPLSAGWYAGAPAQGSTLWSHGAQMCPDSLFCGWHVGVSENGGTPKMDGVYNGKPYSQMDDLAGKPTIFGNTHVVDKSQVPKSHCDLRGRDKLRAPFPWPWDFLGGWLKRSFFFGRCMQSLNCGSNAQWHAIGNPAMGNL